METSIATQKTVVGTRLLELALGMDLGIDLYGLQNAQINRILFGIHSWKVYFQTLSNTSFWYPFLEPHQTTYSSNVRVVQIRISNQIRVVYLISYAPDSFQYIALLVPTCNLEPTLFKLLVPTCNLSPHYSNLCNPQFLAFRTMLLPTKY